MQVVWLVFLNLLIITEGLRPFRPKQFVYRLRSSKKRCFEQALQERENHAKFVFTGTVVKLFHPREKSPIYSGAVKIRRVMKGNKRLIRKNPVLVYGFGNPQFCCSDVKERDSKIFMANSFKNGILTLNSSLVRVTVNNLKRTMAAVNAFIRRWRL